VFLHVNFNRNNQNDHLWNPKFVTPCTIEEIDVGLSVGDVLQAHHRLFNDNLMFAASSPLTDLITIASDNAQSEMTKLQLTLKQEYTTKQSIAQPGHAWSLKSVRNLLTTSQKNILSKTTRPSITHVKSHLIATTRVPIKERIEHCSRLNTFSHSALESLLWWIFFHLWYKNVFTKQTIQQS
jgi:hypothetical protein